MAAVFKDGCQRKVEKAVSLLLINLETQIKMLIVLFCGQGIQSNHFGDPMWQPSWILRYLSIQKLKRNKIPTLNSMQTYHSYIRQPTTRHCSVWELLGTAVLSVYSTGADWTKSAEIWSSDKSL